jgi:hypothetical protein
VNDLEPNEGYNGLQLRALSEHLQDPDSGKHSLPRASGKMSMFGGFTGIASSDHLADGGMLRVSSRLYESRM